MKKFTLLAIILFASFLRLFDLARTPPSLYWDEASLGYNAYSILKTARDEHGKFLPITNFAAFGDYKPPLYIYASVPAIYLFGLNEFAIRFPSAFFGIATVVLTYLLAKKIFQNEALSQLAAFFLAISPWHLQFSRGAFEANLGLFFSTLAIWCFFKFAKDHPFWIFPSLISFLAGMYTFTGQRLFVPVILFILALTFRKELIARFKIVLLALLIFIILFKPLFIFVTQTIEGRLRFDEVTIFKDLEPINQSVIFRELDNDTWWSKIIHNRRFFYAYEYLRHYFDTYNPSFLFSHGDVNPRLSIQEIGELYYFDLPLVLAGIYFLFSQKQKYRWFIIGWLLISPLGPATARETPHALRMIHILPTFQLIAAFGIFNLYNITKGNKLFIIFASLIVALNFSYYLHMYYLHWPKLYSSQWQYGYKETVQTVESYYDKVDYVVVTKGEGRPYIYFLLYNMFDPTKYRKDAEIVKDRFFLIDVNGFDKFRFSDNPQQVPVSGKVLYVVGPDQLPEMSQKVTIIKNLEGNTVFEIGIVSK